VILHHFYLTKFKLDYLKFGFKCKKERFKYGEKFFASLEFDFFEFNSSLLLEYSRKCYTPASSLELESLSMPYTYPVTHI